MILQIGRDVMKLNKHGFHGRVARGKVIFSKKVFCCMVYIYKIATELATRLIEHGLLDK